MQELADFILIWVFGILSIIFCILCLELINQLIGKQVKNVYSRLFRKRKVRRFK